MVPWYIYIVQCILKYILRCNLQYNLYLGDAVMYQIVSKTGLIIEQFEDLETCLAYMDQAAKKGSPAGWLSIRDKDGKEIIK